MVDYNKILYDIEEEYFSVLENHYDSFYLEYKSSGLDKKTYIKNYLSNHNFIKLSKGEDDLSYRRRELKNSVNIFWNQKSTQIKECLKEYLNIGVFGSCDDKYCFYYEDEVRQNALYYDLLILNDPFALPYANDRDYLFGSFLMTFYYNVLTIMDLRQYVLSESRQVYVVIYPTDKMEEVEVKQKILNESENNAKKIAKQIFGIDYSGNRPIWMDFNILKNLSDCEVQRMLVENEIYVNLTEAQQYEFYTMNPESKRKWEEFMIESWGRYNEDFMRCLLNYSIIKHIITTNHYIYKMHSRQAVKLNANPIFNKDEWEPFVYEMSGSSYPASDEFKYMCAVHRNDKMAMMVQMSAQEIEKYRAGKDVEVFRNFLCKAVKSIHNTPECFEEISREVFEKFDSLLEVEYKKNIEEKKKNKFKAIWGIGKALLGYIPYISYLTTTYDLGIGIKNFSNQLNDKETILETMNRRKDK